MKIIFSGKVCVFGEWLTRFRINDLPPDISGVDIQPLTEMNGMPCLLCFESQFLMACCQTCCRKGNTEMNGVHL